VRTQWGRSLELGLKNSRSAVGNRKWGRDMIDPVIREAFLEEVKI
jgi:hypothetical protein